ncbi:zinc finger protein 318-like isoform X2 [Elgaria multicarinata webbii]|uniref:zinc finger protein 318-like isoform X2 n=1 Tax=Elgaria multicarinata webbii TaxID=159646 RepID=UPI002FCCC537
MSECGRAASRALYAAATAVTTMYRASSGRSSVSSSSRSKESSSSGSRSSRSGASTSGSTRGRSPRRSRSPSPRGRRHRSPSSSRSSRRSPSPRRSSRIRSPSGGSWSCIGSEQRDNSLTRRRSPGRRSRSPRSCSPRRRSRSPRSRSPGRRSRSPGRRSPTRHSSSPGRRSPARHSCSPGRRSPSRHSESSVEQSLRITVGNDRYGIDTPERKRLSDRLGSPVDSLSDVDRDDLADGPIFSRGLSHPRSLDRYPSREATPSSPFRMRHDDDYRSRDVFVHQSDYSVTYDHLHDQPRESDRGGELLRKSLYTSEDRGREPKRSRYDRDARVLDMSIEPQGFMPATRNYRKRSLSRSPSPTYLEEDFRELESARRKREEEEQTRNLSRELPGSGYMMPGSTNPVPSSEPRYLYRPDDAPAMPKKSILKKRVEDFSVQPEVFSSSSTSVKEPLHLSNNPPLPQRSSVAPFSLEVENFLKRFNKNAVAESTNKESQGNVHDWRPYSGVQQNTFPFEQNSGSFLKQKEPHESTSEPADRHSDFLLPHERVSQDGSGFSRILGMMADSTSAQEKRRRSFPDDIEDEEKFLYGDDEDGSNVDSPSTQKLILSGEREPVNQKVSSPPPPSPPVKPDTSEESRPEYEKIHDLLKTIGLDIGVAEIGKLAARTQERLHGKKPSRSPDRHLVASHKPESRERRHSRSNTHSPESSQKRSLSPSGSFPPSKDMSSVSNSEYNKSKSIGQDNPAGTPERSVPPISLIPSAPPSHPNLSPPTSVSQYRVSRFPPFPATQLPQNYPPPTMAPPGYNAYGHYMAYAASGWPMYAQQADPALSDVHGLVTLTVPPNPTRPNLRVIETVSTGKGTPDIKRDESVLVQIPSGAPYSIPQFSQPSLKERISDERNRASQKQKVIEEREKLKAEQEARQKKLHYLRTELNRLSKQQGEMLRKKRREKDGHKDPLLVEVNRLQENIVKEIAQLKINADAAEKKQSELDKVAQILGINIFEKSRKLSSENKDPSEKNKSEIAKSQERTSNSIKESKPINDKPKGKSPKPTESSQPSKQQIQAANIYDYYDTGNHWCKDCNTTCGTMFDFFTHMHNKKHRQTLDPYNRPWASKTERETKQEVTKRIDKIPVPAKGSEFLIPVTGYYCQLCHEFFGDQISAEQHVKSHPHNEKYKKHVDENPLYEERRNLDRQAGLSVIQETERRLKRKQCEKQKEEKDEKTAKVSRKEEPKSTKELGDGDNEHETSKRKEVPNGQKCEIKLKLKKDDKEVEKKEGKKEESPKESRLSSFGKFSWRKTEREEKNQDKDVFREESAEESKDKESKPQSGKPNSKPIAIKLSGKTVIPHTSPWTPVVSTSSQAKIRPNLPIPMMVLRKSATTTVSKPAPLNTFLSIKSSGATTKPLPVVKEGNPELVLAPDIISKAFGGEVVVLKNSQDKTKAPEQPEEKEHESVSKALEHARALEHAKANAAKVQEQASVMAKAQAKARELAAMAKEQEVTRGAKINDQSMIFERSHRRPPLLPLPPGPPLTLAVPLPRPPAILFPPPPLMPPKETIILADDMAPGVSEDDKNILAVPMCPHPLPPPTIFRDHVNKLEKKNSSLAAGNAKDLYDIFYNNSGRSPADSKLMNSATSDKGKINPIERERNTDLLVNSKPSNNSFAQECSSSDVSKIPSGDGTAEPEEVKAEKKAACEENIDLKTEDEGGSEKISISNTLSTFKYKEVLESNNLATSASVAFQNEEEMGTPAPIEFSKKSPELVRAELDIQIPKRSPLPLDDFSKKSTDLQLLEDAESYNLPSASVPFQNEVEIGTPTATEFIKKLPNLEKAELARQLPQRSAPAFKNDSKNPSEFETAEFKSSDDNKLTVKFSENSVSPLGDVSKNPLELKTAELAMQLLEGNAPLLEDDSKKPSELGTAEFESPHDKELTMQLLEYTTAPLEDLSKKSSELGTTEIKSPDDKELMMQSLEYTTASLEDFSKNPFKRDRAELVTQLPEISAPSLEELHKNPSETGAAEFKSLDDKELTMQSLEYTTAPLEDLSKKSSELGTTEIKSPDDKELMMQSLEYTTASLEDFSKNPFKRDRAELVTQLPEISAPSLEELHKNPSETGAAEFKSLDDKELTMQSLEYTTAPLEDLSKKSSELGTTEIKSPDDKELMMQSLEYTTASLEDFSKNPFKRDRAELVTQLPEISAPSLEELHKNPSETGAAEFKSLDDKELTMQSLEYTTAPLEDLSKKSSELGTTEIKSPDDKELMMQSLEYTTASLEDFSKNPFKRDRAELAIQFSESNAPPLEELHKNPSEIEGTEFKSPDDTELAMHLPEKEAGLSKEPVIMRHVGVTSCEDIDEKLQDQQNTEVCDQSKLEEINSDLEVKAYVTSLGERDVGRERLESADHNFAVSQGDKSQLFEIQIETPKGEGPIITEEKQIDDSSEQTTWVSTWVSDICVQSQVAWEPIDLSSKVSEKSPQIVVREQSFSKESSLGLKLGPVGIERLEPAVIDESPQTSEVLNIDPELKPLNKGELDSFHTNSEQDLLVNFPPRDNEAFNVVNAPSSGEMPNECLANITMVSSTVGEYEQINQQPLSCEVKDLEVEGTKALDSISSTTDAETSSSVELMFLQNDTQRSSESHMKLSYMEETPLIETKNAIFSSIQPEMVQEPLDALPTEISVGHLGEEALTFTAMNTGVLNTSAADDFDLNSTYSELSFNQTTTLTLNLKVENERDSLKSDEIKPTDPSELKPGLELETIHFSLGDIEVEREHLSILPSEILNEDTVESPKLETITSICLKSSKTSELGIDQPAVEPEMIDFVVSASGDQEDKFCSLVSDAIVSHMGSPAPNSDTAEPSMSLIEMQGMPSVSGVFQLDVSQGGTSDMSSLSCVGKNVENQAAACMEPLHPDRNKTSVEVGGSGNSELYSEMQTSGGEITKMEEENDDNRSEVHSKLTLEVTDNSTKHLLL